MADGDVTPKGKLKENEKRGREGEETGKGSPNRTQRICGVTIGCYAFVGAGAVVLSDVPDFALLVGVPATQVGWMSEYGEQIPLPLEGSGEYTCPHSGKIYRLEKDRLECLGVV